MGTTVLGGGLSGLSAAYYLLKKFPSQPVTVIESTKRVGGWIKSHKQDDGIIFEQGPRTIRLVGPAGHNTLSLLEDLELGDKIRPVLSSNPAARNRMLFANGQLHSLPSTFGGLFKTQTPFSQPIMKYLSNDIFAAKKPVDDEPIYDFAQRRFGDDVADYLISPLICGICAGNAKEISVNFLMKKFFDYEQTYGSISVGLVRNLFTSTKSNSPKVDGRLHFRAKQENWNVYSLKNGLETLPKTLEGFLLNNSANLLVNNKCDKITFNDQEVNLTLSNGTNVASKHLISALPAETLANLLETQHPVLTSHLRNIKSVTVAVVNLHFNSDLIQRPGFGFLVPPKEELPILGVIYDSCCFPDGQNTILTVMMGGFWFEKYFGDNPTEEEIYKTAKEHLRLILGIDRDPVDYKVNILQKCIPQYVVGHNENLQKIEEYISEKHLPISLCGASYYGVGINDVILSAKNVVDKIDFNK